MNLHRIIISFLFVISTFAASANAVDTTIADNLSLQKETLPVITKHNPRTATRRSAIIPGWGQAYNKEYWKIPIVYGALSIPTITFFYNNTWYNRTKSAYDLVYKASDPLTATKQDTLNLQNVYQFRFITNFQKCISQRQGFFCIVVFDCLGIECCRCHCFRSFKRI